MRPGPRNLITDVAGLKVGNSSDATLKSGVTVLSADTPFVASVHVMGGAPGTRELSLLEPDKSVQSVDALVLSGGSAFGLDACSGVVNGLRKTGRGFAVGDVRVPIVPGAIIFDLLNGGDKDWDRNPYADLGEKALTQLSDEFSLGSVGAGVGAMCARLKGGLGSASLTLNDGVTVGALVVANPVGSAVTSGGKFWAAPFEINQEFGGLGADTGTYGETRLPLKTDAQEGANTTIAIVATDAKLGKSQAKRLAIAAHDGMARAIVPSHTPMDGDLVFAVSHGQKTGDLAQIGHAAATCLARAISRAVFEATPAEGDLLPCFRDLAG
ncbi:D-aminopeptidase [Litoreibacter ponti]|uniref:D-aminopeptidase n=1 Tax=Litoreibacter ponti TaxID=1510457 RepID=A0A2T6BFV2_9RHOB|nr:P1 family peptidase [Litoreibacter ponti]PTX54942.1 D-aminopeptidase [Litoreibacter ponti]